MPAETKRTTDHDAIREWAEIRAGVPARVRGTESDDNAGTLRIDLPDAGGEDPIEHISWEEWFQAFDEQNLCFLYQEEKVSGEESTFFKLMERTGD
jgi:hypothetical protein